MARFEGVALAVVNPAASSGRAGSLWRRLEPGLRARFPDLSVRFSESPGDAERIAHGWGLEHPVGALLVAGGDGTLHEAVNGLFRSASRASLGVLPAGSGNDFARNAAIPLDPLAAAQGLSPTPLRSIDLGLLSFAAEGEPVARVFLNSVSLGLSVEANRLARALAGIRPSRLRYALAGLAAVLSGKPAGYLVTSGDAVLLDGPALNLTVANGGSFGGGMRISPDSSPSDGVLELVVLGSLSRLRALRAFSRLQAGTHLSLPQVSVAPLQGAVRIRGAKAQRVEADGEELAADEELLVRILPSRLALLNAPA